MTAITLTNTQIRAAADLADKRKRFRRTLFIVGTMGLLLSLVLWYFTAGMSGGRSSQGDKPFWHELDEAERQKVWQAKEKPVSTYATGLHLYKEQLFAVSTEGRLHVFLKESGRSKKTVNLKDHDFKTSTYSFYADLLFQQTDKMVDGMVITQFTAFELPDCKIMWKKVSKPALPKYPRVAPPPVVIDKRVVFCRHDNYFHTYSAREGTLKWICPADEPSVLDKSAPFLASHLFKGPKRIVYLTNDESRPQLTHTRNQLQQYKWKPDYAVLQVVRNSGVHTCRRFIEGQVRAMCSGGEKALLLLRDGALKTVTIASGEDGWSKDGPFSSPILGADRKFICCSGKTISAFSETTGDRQWELETKAINVKGEMTFSYLASSGKTLFVAGRSTENTFLAAFSLTTGKHKWSLPGVGVVNKDPRVYSDITVFNCADGRLYGVNSENGAVVWRSGYKPAAASAP